MAPLALIDGEKVPASRSVGPQVFVWRSWRRFYLAGLVFSDTLSAVLALGLLYEIRPWIAAQRVAVLNLNLSYRLLGLVTLGVWLSALALSGAYSERYPVAGVRDYRIPAVTALRLMAAVAVGSFALRAPLSRGLVVMYFPMLLVLSLICRWVLRQGLGRLRERGWAVNRLVLAGDAEAVDRLADHLVRAPAHGYRIVGVCVSGATTAEGDRLRTLRGGHPVFGSPDDVARTALALSADSVVLVGQPAFSQTSLQGVAWQLEREHVAVLVAPDIVELAGPRIRFSPVKGMPLLHITEPRIGGFAKWGKPIYERLVALALVTLALPVFAMVAVAILIDSGRPVFYRQRRIGLGEREFEMLKFRSMVPDAESMLADLLVNNEHDGALFKMRSDPRVTRVGRFIRKYSLDELPQLFNVLRGEMVLVGPRPCLPSETDGFGEAARRRFLARPGLTGLWQVNGRSDIPWEEAVRLDLYYVENWSLLLDAMILFRTLRVVVQGRGGY